MSLLSESVQTVLQGQSVVRFWGINFCCRARAIGFYPIIDLVTGTTMKLPVGAVPTKLLFEPLIPQC